MNFSLAINLTAPSLHLPPPKESTLFKTQKPFCIPVSV